MNKSNTFFHKLTLSLNCGEMKFWTLTKTVIILGLTKTVIILGLTKTVIILGLLYGR